MLSRRGSLFGSFGGAPTSPAAAASTGRPGLGPEATVRAYYAAISTHRYLVAWHLGANEPGRQLRPLHGRLQPGPSGT